MKLSYEGIPIWRHAKFVRASMQILSGVLVLVLLSWFFINIAGAIESRNIPYGFGFLERSYQTPIGHSFLPYESSDTFLYALVVGLVNTLAVSVIGVFLATILGIIIGVCRLSKNWLVNKTALIYVEAFRNIPLLIQLFFWFYVMLYLPQIKESIVLLNSFYINNSGFSFPFFQFISFAGALLLLFLLVLSVISGVLAFKTLQKRKKTARLPSLLMAGLAGGGIIFFTGWLIISLAFSGSPAELSLPRPEGAFGRIQGGLTIPAGLIALLVGLVVYTSAFIAEIVRAGIQSVNKGQVEAARSLGLSKLGTLKTIVFPQSLRVIVPPSISQYLNLTKNSSLAGAIGYSDLVNVAKTMTQTAPAVSIFVIIMAAYLVISLVYSIIGNIYNKRIKFTGG